MIHKIIKKLKDFYWLFIYLFNSLRDPWSFNRLANEEEIQIIENISTEKEDFKKFQNYLEIQGFSIERQEFNHTGISQLYSISKNLYYIDNSGKKGYCVILLHQYSYKDYSFIAVNCTIDDASGKRIFFGHARDGQIYTKIYSDDLKNFNSIETE